MLESFLAKQNILNRELLEAQIAEIETLRSALADLPEDIMLKRVLRLNQLRIKSSTTLSNWVFNKHGLNQAELNKTEQNKNAANEWLAANHFVSECLQAGLAPMWAQITELNGILDGTHAGAVRECQIFIGRHQTCGPAQLQKDLGLFVNEVLPNKEGLHCLIHASKVRYWLATLHPFFDANGRTANLCCDWLLGLQGYLPLSCQTKVDSLIGGWESRSEFSTLDFAIQKTLHSLKESYLVVLSQDIYRED